METNIVTPHRECYECKALVPTGSMTNVHQGTRRHSFVDVCETCKSSAYFYCADCNEYYSTQNRVERFDGEFICLRCDESYYTCNSCYARVHEDDILTCEHCSSGYCSGCGISCSCEERGGSRHSINYHDYDTGNTEHQSETRGAIVNSLRKWSAEIECCYKNHGKAATASRALPNGVGVDSDGSVQGGAGGLEIQTPILKGKAGEQCIKSICKTLEQNDFFVNRSCGLHVHIDAGNESNEESWNKTNLSRLIAFYVAFEDVLLSFLPYSRRVSTYCKSLRLAYHVSEILNIRTKEGLERLWYRARNRNEVMRLKQSGKFGSDTRYYGANFHSLLSANHFEVRYHSGTIADRKILEWVNLHTAILDKAWVLNNDALTNVARIVSLHEKTNLLFSTLNLTPQSIDYFLQRQKKFMPIEAKETDENALTPTPVTVANPETVCAE